MNSATFGGSQWGGPTYLVDEPMLDAAGRELFAPHGTVWRVRRAPILAVPGPMTVSAVGHGVAGCALEPGAWFAVDTQGHSLIFAVPALPDVLVVMLSAGAPDFAQGVRRLVVERPDTTAAFVGGVSVPIYASAEAQDGQCVLPGVPVGFVPLIRLVNAPERNLWFVSWDAYGVHAIDFTLRRVPTDAQLASSVADVTVKVEGVPVAVQSVDPNGTIILASEPAEVPTCSYWVLTGDRFS